MLNIAVCMLLIIITLAGFTKVYKIGNISHLETDLLWHTTKRRYFSIVSDTEHSFAYV